MAGKAEKLLLVENNQSHKEDVVILSVMELQWEVCLQNYSKNLWGSLRIANSFCEQNSDGF